MTARTLKFVYGALTIGVGQSGTLHTLTGLYSFNEGYSVARLSFLVAINASTVSAFLTAEAALVVAYTKPDQKLEVVLSSTTRHTYDPSSSVNTGFNQRATCRRVPHDIDTDRSGMYECSVAVELPADLSGRAGRLGSSVNVQEDPSGRRTCTVTGIYTALSNVQARAQFAAQIDAYATTGVIGGLGGTWDLIADVDAEADDQDKNLGFRRVYREIKRDQSAGGTDLTSVVNPSMIIRRSVVSNQSRAFSAEPPVRLRVEYSADVKFSVTTDLDDLWTSTIRPYALSEIEAATGTTILVVVGEDWTIDPGNNRLEAELDLVGESGALFWQLRKEWSEKENDGTVLRPVWNGNPFARDKYQGMATHTIALTYQTTGPSRVGSGPGGMPRVPHPGPQSIAGFEQPRTSRRLSERSIGIAGEETPIYVATTTYFYVRADVEEGGGGFRFGFGGEPGGGLDFGDGGIFGIGGGDIVDFGG